MAPSKKPGRVTGDGSGSCAPATGTPVVADEAKATTPAHIASAVKPDAGMSSSSTLSDPPSIISAGGNNPSDDVKSGDDNKSNDDNNSSAQGLGNEAGLSGDGADDANGDDNDGLPGNGDDGLPGDGEESSGNAADDEFSSNGDDDDGSSDSDKEDFSGNVDDNGLADNADKDDFSGNGEKDDFSGNADDCFSGDGHGDGDDDDNRDGDDDGDDDGNGDGNDDDGDDDDSDDDSDDSDDVSGSNPATRGRKRRRSDTSSAESEEVANIGQHLIRRRGMSDMHDGPRPSTRPPRSPPEKRTRPPPEKRVRGPKLSGPKWYTDFVARGLRYDPAEHEPGLEEATGSPEPESLSRSSSPDHVITVMPEGATHEDVARCRMTQQLAADLEEVLCKPGEQMEPMDGVDFLVRGMMSRPAPSRPGRNTHSLDRLAETGATFPSVVAMSEQAEKEKIANEKLKAKEDDFEDYVENTSVRLAQIEERLSRFEAKLEEEKNEQMGGEVNSTTAVGDEGPDQDQEGANG